MSCHRSLGFGWPDLKSDTESSQAPVVAPVNSGIDPTPIRICELEYAPLHSRFPTSKKISMSSIYFLINLSLQKQLPKKLD